MTIDNYDYLYARHRNLAEKISSHQSTQNNGYLSGLSVGNSIVQGTGTTGATKTFSVRLGAGLADWYGYGTGNDWTSSNGGVGGSNIANVAGYVCHDGDYESVNMIQRGADLPNRDYILMMSLRNDVSTMDLDDYVDVLRTTLRHIKNQRTDVIFITEPPKINTTTGFIEDDADNWTPWYEAAKRICGEEGVSVVDEWQYWVDQKNAGYDLRTRTSDGVHYDDETHQHIADQLVRLFKLPVESSVQHYEDTISNVGRGCLIGKYVDSASTATTTISGLTTSRTGRFLVKGEGTKESFVITTGNFLSFQAPAQVRGIIITMVGGSSNTGTASVNYNGVAVANGTGLSGGSNVREFSYYLPLNSGDAGASSQYGVAQQYVRVTATGGQIEITGVVFLCSKVTSYNSPAANAAETGTWADTTLPNTSAARRSNNVGDTYTYRFYGTGCNLSYTMGTNQGKFGWTIDGGSSTTVDAYLNASATAKVFTSIKNLSRGWHTLVITVETKNASSSDNYVTLGDFFTYDYNVKGNTQFVEATAGDTVYVPDYWETVSIYETISGSPLPPDFTAGDETLVLRGTGAAILKLERS